MIALNTPAWRLRLRNINSWLLVAFGFILPFSVAADGILAGLIAFLSLLAGVEVLHYYGHSKKPYIPQKQEI